ncbi:hypothetical protein ACP70R_012492 [Stipagrostis hirtigluma subsp. patula]
MALPAKVFVSVVVVILLLFSAASFSLTARSRSYGEVQSTWDDRGYQAYFKTYISLQSFRDKRKYQTYFVLLRKHPNGEAMDDKDARRRWYESFLPSTLTDSGEPRLLHCYPFEVNGFLASLTRAEAMVLADKPGLRSMHSDYLERYHSSTASCGFETKTSTKRSFVRSRPAF